MEAKRSEDPSGALERAQPSWAIMASEVQQLLHKKSVVILGILCRDLVFLLQRLPTHSQAAQGQGEMSFEQEALMNGGQKIFMQSS